MEGDIELIEDGLTGLRGYPSASDIARSDHNPETQLKRMETISTAYERFNNRDFAGVLDLFEPDAEHCDLLREGAVHRGRAAILKLWTERFAEASVQALVYDIFEIGDTVVAVVRYQAHDPDGTPCGSPMVAVHRFIFTEARIARLEVTVIDPLSDDARALFLQPT